MRYRKKPVVINAIQLNLEDHDEVLQFFNDFNVPFEGGMKDLTIHTLEGPLHATLGDWIIVGVRGEAYPCKPDIFEATYEPEREGGENELEDHHRPA